MRLATRLALLLPLAWNAISPAAAQFDAPDLPCPLGIAEATLIGADVQAALLTNGNLFFGNESTASDGYIVPRGSGNSPLFASNLWVGGQVNGEVRTAAARYSGFQLRPGLTGDDGTAPSPEACAAADRIWVVSREDVQRYLSGGAPEADLAEWPVHLGAPVLDGDGVEGNYDLASGDQPAIRGDVMAFWVMTDTAVGRSRDELPVGIDVAVEAFAFLEARLGKHTFYRFTLTNRNAVPIDSAYVGLFSDVDLGDARDDYIATDTTGQMHFYYNAFETDATYGIPPAFGAVVARGPVGLPNGRDDDGDGDVDEPGERLGLTSSTPIYGSGPLSAPSNAAGYYNRLKGLWNDGSVIRENGSGYQQPSRYPSTPFIFTGDPTTESFWSEVNADGSGANVPTGDRRGTLGTGPFRLAPGASETVAFAYVFAQGTDRFDSIRKLRGQARGILAAEASGGFEPVRVGNASPRPLPLSIGRPRPNPFSGSTAIEIRGAAPEASLTVTVYDVLGRLVRAPEAVEGLRRSVRIGEGLASGVYVVRVEGAGFAETFTIVKTR